MFNWFDFCKENAELIRTLSKFDTFFDTWLGSIKFNVHLDKEHSKMEYTRSCRPFLFWLEPRAEKLITRETMRFTSLLKWTISLLLKSYLT